MGLLDRIKQNATEKAATSPAATAPNPFGAKTGEKVAPVAVSEPAAKVNPLAAKVNPLAGAKVNPLAKPAAAATTPLATTEKKNPLGNPLGKPKAPVVAPVEEAKEPVEEKVEQDIVEAIKEDDKKALPVEVKAETEEIELGKEDKKVIPATGKGSRGGKSKAAATTTAPAEKKSELVASEQFVIPTTSISFDEAIEALSSPFVDERWTEFKTSIETQLAEIVIEDDMNPGSMKVTISRLSQIRQAISTPYQEMKTRFEELVNKEPEGLIERVKKLNISGTNDLERKRTGIMACMSYVPPTGEGPMNLYEVLSEVRARHNFLKISMDSVQYKTNILITMSSALKLENSHLPGEQ
jgi:hypothetical protein